MVDAIHRYESFSGKLPNALEELVPRELESIPDTGMIGFPSFQYVGPKARRSRTRSVYSRNTNFV